MGCTCAPALVTARNELNLLWPHRDKASDGCCGDAAHRARKSDHNPNERGYACAFDYDEDVTDNLGDRELWGMGIVLLADPRTKYLIYEKRLLYPDGTDKPYTGVNDHKSHLHHSIHSWADRDTSPWGIARAFAHLEDDMAAFTDGHAKVLTKLNHLIDVEGTDLDGKIEKAALLRLLFTINHNAAIAAAQEVGKGNGTVAELAAALADELGPELARELLDAMAARLDN